MSYEMTWSGALADELPPKRLKPVPNSILIVSRNRTLREAFAQTLGARGGASIRVANGLYADTARRILVSRAQILALDVVALLLEPRQRMREIRAAFPDLKIMLINMGENDDVFREAAQLGVDGYLLHGASVSEVAAAFDAVMNGAIVCPPKFLRKLFSCAGKRKTLLV